MGGLAYAAWFVGLLATGIVVHALRGQGYTSLASFITARYGRLSGLVFILLAAWRLLTLITRETAALGNAFGQWDASVDALTSDWCVLARGSARLSKRAPHLRRCVLRCCLIPRPSLPISRRFIAAVAGMAIAQASVMIGGVRATLRAHMIQTLVALVLVLVLAVRVASSISPELERFTQARHGSSSLFLSKPGASSVTEVYTMAGGGDLLLSGTLMVREDLGT